MRERLVKCLFVGLIVGLPLRGKPETATPWELPARSILCIEEQSVGFDWKEGAWVPRNFKPRKHVLKKVNFGELAPGVCGTFLGKAEESRVHNDAGFAALDRCYSVREFGEEQSPVHSQLCTEYYRKSGGKFRLTEVACTEEQPLHFTPDGWFHRGHVHGDVETKPAKDYKDSLSIAVGHCSTV